MKRLFAVALGILTAIGGFVDIGDLVTNAQVGARFGLSIAPAVVVGVVGICLFAEMSGRVAATSGRATFDLVRERLGPRVGLLNLAGSMGVTFLTFIAEIGGVALSLQLVTSVHELLWVPFVALAVWLLLWRAKFSAIENVLGLLGLSLIVFAVALWQLGPDWGALAHQAVTADKPGSETWTTDAYYAVALFGAIAVDTLGETALPVAEALGKVGLAIVVLGFVAATFGAACETGLSVGYSLAQYVGEQWGKYVRPQAAVAFHTVLVLCAMAAAAVLLTGVDPIAVTEVSVVFSAVALPLTYFPILVIANDPDYVGEHTNGRVTNLLGTLYLVLIVVAALAAIPLMVITGMGA